MTYVDILVGENSRKIGDALKSSVIRKLGKGYVVNLCYAVCSVSHRIDRSILITVEFGRNISDYTIKDYEHTGGYVLNIHRADPTKYRGASVLNHQILAGEDTIEVHAIHVKQNEPLDNRRGVAFVRLNIEGMLYSEVVDECHTWYAELIKEAVYTGTDVSAIERTGLLKRRSPEDSQLFLTEEQIKIIKASDNKLYPAFFMHGLRRFNLTVTSYKPTD